MTGGEQLTQLVAELQEVADRLSCLELHEDVRLYVTLGLQVAQESGSEAFRRSVVDDIGEALGASPEPLLTLYRRTRADVAYGGGYASTYTGMEMESSDTAEPAEAGTAHPRTTPAESEPAAADTSRAERPAAGVADR